MSFSGAEFDVRFFGDYRSDIHRCREYLERKLLALVEGWRSIETIPSFLGIVLTTSYPLTEGERTDAVRQLLETHIRTQLDPAQVQEALVRISLRIEDRYFLSLQLTNYESRLLERPMFPGQQYVAIYPWEGTVESVGLQLVIDANNRLTGFMPNTAPRVTPQEVGGLLDLLERAVQVSAERFITTGDVSIGDLVREQR
jgi:hypothetical protein